MKNMKKQDMVRMALAAVCVIVLIWSAAQLIGYFSDARRTRKLNEDLKAAYYAAETAQTETPIQAAAPETHTPEPTGTVTPIPPTRTPSPTQDPFGGYPNNRFREVSPQFVPVRKSYPDVCAWIRIGSELDQAVVQRDNTFYLDHDYTGQHNVNGAIFLEENISLLVRPTAYVLYGHNMKTQAMFGMLHKYSDKTFLREHALIQFDTIYEEGSFAVFAAGEVELDPGSYRFAAFYDLPTAVGERRMEIIDSLKTISDHRIALDVSADDQLLLLVTCTGDDSRRRFVAARRLREGEDEQSLSMTYWTME